MVTGGALLGRNDAFALPDVLHTGYNVPEVLQNLRHSGVCELNSGSVISLLSKAEQLLREFQRGFGLSPDLVAVPKSSQCVKKLRVVIYLRGQFPPPREPALNFRVAPTRRHRKRAAER